jgi:hypothetical protein
LFDDDQHDEETIPFTIFLAHLPLVAPPSLRPGISFLSPSATLKEPSNAFADEGKLKNDIEISAMEIGVNIVNPS